MRLMPKVPRKNISSKMADIVPRIFSSASRRPKAPAPIKTDRVEQFAPLPRSQADQKPLRNIHVRPFSFWRLTVVFLIAALVVGGVVSSYAYRALPPSKDSADGSHLIDWGRIKTLFTEAKNIGSHLATLRDASSGTFALLAEAKTFAASAIQDARAGRGDLVISRLENLKQLLGKVAGASDLIFDSRVTIDRTSAFLDHLIGWLKEDRDHHIAIFLENPSELRPGGGFLGSYVDVVVRGGNIVTSTVRDISDADGVMNRKIVPPAPLQLIVKRWRAADANWFFDFPESASTTLSFLESSDLYRSSGITFDMAIGVSGHAIEDMLAVTGPIKLPDGTEVRSDNVLSVLQARVQEGQSLDSEDAKAVLKDFAPLLFEKLLAQVSATSTDETATGAGAGGAGSDNSLLSYVQSWIESRDIRIFAKDPAFESFFDTIGATGTAYQIPEKFNGDYLAITRANIGGGKSDTFIKEKVSVESQIAEEGTVNTHLIITRAHTATDADPWWYNAPNQAYVQVMASPTAALTYANGGVAKKIVPRAEYATDGYETNADVAAEESSIEEHLDYSSIDIFRDEGKRVFATWLRTQPGATSSLELAYTTHLVESVRAGMTYTLVFEKQSGMDANYDFQISAPVGYVFAENELPVYEYQASEIPGRLILTLTLKPITDL
jgi:Protein of unknown function (DUF4012)